ncbi:MAG: amidohydrolase [Chloroflexi bacterium]|nr:amidohydrolase [Chloroflexota bacterium]
MRIDLHCHYYPPEYIRALENSGLMGMTAGGLTMRTLPGIEGRLAAMAEAKVDVEVLSVSAPSVFFADCQLSLALAQICNDSLSEVCGNDPDHFRALVSVPLTDVAAAIDELHRARRKTGMVGVALGTTIARKPLDSPEFWPFYEELDRLRLPAFIHPMEPVDVPLVRDYMMTASIGYLYETCTAATRLVLSGVRERYPNFPIVLCHLGGALPFISDRIDHAARRYEETRKNISRPPSDYLRQMYYDTAQAYGPGPLDCALQFAGEDHIVLGTDYPFTSAEHTRVVPSLESAPLSAEAKEKIFGKNAGRILRGVEP